MKSISNGYNRRRLHEESSKMGRHKLVSANSQKKKTIQMARFVKLQVSQIGNEYVDND